VDANGSVYGLDDIAEAPTYGVLLPRAFLSVRDHAGGAQQVPRRPEAEYVIAAIVTAVAYMASLLAHELAHSLVARRNGVQVEGITLWLLGGVSRLQGEFPDPGAELRVAGVGPLTSLVWSAVISCWPAGTTSGCGSLFSAGS
jgi:Zn-dependent protease